MLRGVGVYVCVCAGVFFLARLAFVTPLFIYPPPLPPSNCGTTPRMMKTWPGSGAWVVSSSLKMLQGLFLFREGVLRVAFCVFFKGEKWW